EVPRLDAGRRAAARRTAQLRAAAGVRGRARAEGARRDPGRRVLATGRAALLSSPAVRLAPARPRRPRRLGDPAFRALSLAFALSVIAIAGTIAVVLLRRSALARAAFGWSFLWTSTWDPVALRFGALPFIYGTLATTAIAIAIALPLGLGAAVCLAELMPRRLADPLTFLIELLVAVPSVIYGLVGVFVLVPAIRSLEQTVQPVLGSIPFFAGPAYGVGLLAAGILLAVMIVPFIGSGSSGLASPGAEGRPAPSAQERDRPASPPRGATHVRSYRGRNVRDARRARLPPRLHRLAARHLALVKLLHRAPGARRRGGRR